MQKAMHHFAYVQAPTQTQAYDIGHRDNSCLKNTAASGEHVLLGGRRDIIVISAAIGKTERTVQIANWNTTIV